MVPYKFALVVVLFSASSTLAMEPFLLPRAAAAYRRTELQLSTRTSLELAPTARAIHLERLGYVLKGTAGIAWYMDYNYTHQWWWGYRGVPHQEVNNRYGLYLDKLNHGASWFMIGETYRWAYQWAGFTPRAAAWSAFGTVALLHGLTEFVYESRAPHFGADWQDFAFGVGLGGGLVVARQYAPWLMDVRLKWTYWPRTDPPYAKYYPWMSDYRAQTIWVCVSPAFMRPFGLSVGINKDDWRYDVGRIQVWLSLDIDWVALWGEWWLPVALNYAKAPLPGIRLAPRFGFSAISYKNY